MNSTIIAIQHDAVWLKASVLGGLWASVEIIIGSFFHNLRIPLAGTLLAAHATVLMVAFYQIWSVKGLIWRAGLIAALMKSVSPSAVILGPMIGILIEAFVVEFFIRYFGNNLVSLGIAGALSVSSALIHKVVSLLVLYGFRLITLFLDVYQFLARQLHIENTKPLTLVIIVCAMYVAFGSLSAFIGYFVGMRSKKRSYIRQGFIPEKVKVDNLFALNPDQQYSILLFVIHALMIPAGLVLMRVIPVQFILLFVFIYSILCLKKYRKGLRRLLKPVFWIQLLVIVLIAAVDWNKLQSGGLVITSSGLLMGAEMALRAVFVVVAFSSFSVELRNPEIRKQIFKKGFDKIYTSLGLAFSALPVMVAAMPTPGFFIRHPVDSFTQMMNHAREWLFVFETGKVTDQQG
jgi:hypothetical protein